MEQSWLDSGQHQSHRLSALVVAGINPDRALAARQLVLLDSPLDAQPAPVQTGARRSSRQPPSDRMGGDELSPMGSGNRRGVHPRPRLHHPNACQRIGGCAFGHDAYGRHQSYGLGIISTLHG
jgi:hypothetical protein